MSDAASDTHLNDIIEKALDAAQLATEAAHEAEVAISARNEVVQALSKTARQTRQIALGAAAGAMLVLVVGGLLSARASNHLSQAAEVHASATASFVENLMLLNDALDQIQHTIDGTALAADRSQAEVNTLVARLDQRLEDIAREFAGSLESSGSPASNSTDLLLVLAEIEANLSQQLASLALRPQAAPLPAQQTATATPQPAQPARSTRPAPRPASRPEAPANPFRFP